MLDTLKKYFYDHYEDDGEPYTTSTSYEEVSDYFKRTNNDDIYELIFCLGLHVLAKSIVTESIDRLEDEYAKEKSRHRNFGE